MTQMITIDEVRQEAMSLTQQAETIIIVTHDHAEQAVGFLALTKQMRKKIADVFDPIVRKAWEAHKEAKIQYNRAIDPVEQAEGVVKKKLGDYQAEEKRKHAEESFRIARLQAGIEASAWAEAKAKAEAERRRLEDDRLTAALEAAARGDNETSEKILEQEIDVVPYPVVIDLPAPPVPIQKLDGLSFRTDWKYEIVHPSAIPMEYMIIDEKKIGQVVRALKEKTNIPGVRPYPVEVPINRS